MLGVRIRTPIIRLQRSLKLPGRMGADEPLCSRRADASIQQISQLAANKAYAREIIESSAWLWTRQRPALLRPILV